MFPHIKPICLLLCLILFSLTSSAPSTPSPTQNQPNIEKLLSKMTLEEKIGQMTQICFSTITLDGTKNLDLDADAFREAITEHHVGSFLSGSGPAEKWVTFLTEVQRIAIEETRLGIPLLIGIDHVHGANYVNEGTIFPHNLGLSCSFDTTLIAETARITAKETLGLGIHWNFSPVLDLGKNPVWPRLYETFGEDPLLCAMMGKAYIEAMQEVPEGFEQPMAACAKHFIGYSDPKSGWDRTPSEIPEQLLHEFFAPSFQAAFDAGVRSVMVNSGELNGEPVHGSKYLLQDVLREKMGFEGVVLTDIKDIDKIIELHQGAIDVKEATRIAIDAGIDMNMACNAFHFCKDLKELVAEGKITEDRIDASVRRILQLKKDLGLFEHPYPKGIHPNEKEKVHHREVAIQAATESIVLMKNEGNVLPLPTSTDKILVAGFAADSKHHLSGPWTFEWLGQPDEKMHSQHMHTLTSALEAAYPKSEVLLSKAVSKAQFMKEANDVDAVIMTIGEEPYSEFKGNITDLMLDKKHQQLATWACESGKPLILVLVEGRPRVLGSLASSASAILFAGYPGFGGADALAGIIKGEVNPSGKLAFSYPASPNHYVPYYHKPSEKYFLDYQKVPQSLYPFGHGLSFTSFAYHNLTLDAKTMTKEGVLKARVEVANTGDFDGKETVLWYIHDHTGSITRPVKQLKHFEKRLIKKKEKAVFEFEIDAKSLCYPDKNGNMLLEPGTFTLMVGEQEISFSLQ